MEFAFLTDPIREICQRRALAIEELGEEAALDLERKLADIDACGDALEFRALCHDDLEELSEHRWLLRLSGGWHVEMVAGHAKPRRTETGATDWGKVTRLRIEALGRSDD